MGNVSAKDLIEDVDIDLSKLLLNAKRHPFNIPRWIGFLEAAEKNNRELGLEGDAILAGQSRAVG
jgi:hypothetical protein